MKIFDIVNGRAVPHAEALIIPEFKVLWERDKDKDKGQAIKELSYVVFLIDESVSNPYRAYNTIDRDVVLRRDFFGSKTHKVDKPILAAVEKYKELAETTSMRLLRAAKSATDKLSEYFENVDFNATDNYGKPLFNSRELSTNLKEVGGIIKSLNLLEEFVKKEQTESKVRGGGEIGMYEIPRNDFDYGE